MAEPDSVYSFEHYKAFARGDIRIIPTDHPDIKAYLRTFQDHSMLHIVSSADDALVAGLALDFMSGSVPVDTATQTQYAPIPGNALFTVRMNAREQKWLVIKPEAIPEDNIDLQASSVAELLESANRHTLEQTILPGYLSGRRWFGGKGRSMVNVSI